MDSALYVLYNKNEKTYVKCDHLTFGVSDDKPAVLLNGQVFKTYDFEQENLTQDEFDLQLTTRFEEEFDVYVLYSAVIGSDCGCNDCSCENHDENETESEKN